MFGVIWNIFMFYETKQKPRGFTDTLDEYLMCWLCSLNSTTLITQHSYVIYFSVFFCVILNLQIKLTTWKCVQSLSLFIFVWASFTFITQNTECWVSIHQQSWRWIGFIKHPVSQLLSVRDQWGKLPQWLNLSQHTLRPLRATSTWRVNHLPASGSTGEPETTGDTPHSRCQSKVHSRHTPASVHVHA